MLFSVFHLIWLVAHVTSFDQLPGVDDIASGYDASKMLSASEQNSKFRIFDLTDLRATPYKTKVLGKDRSYTLPKFVQVTDVSLRRENTCETFALTFESFSRSYFRSTSFGVSIDTGKYQAAVGYSETLKRVQEAITKNQQAVGISTTWWGLYSVQLAPTFILKQDPMFTETVNMLASEAPNPSTEDHQAYYNQFVATYGTHYVSRIVVGGTAHLYTLVSSSFHKASSYEETTSQISISFGVKKIEGRFGSQTEMMLSTLKETFRKSAASFSEFQPPIEPRENASDWDTWKLVAGDQPVVVNRTIFPIHDLIRGKPTVREHLRKTVEYYVRTGSLPTLAELKGRKTNRLDSPPEPIGPLPGLDVVGCGYDVLLMQSKLCVLDQSNVSEHELWSDPTDKTQTYSLPNGWFAINTPESLSLDVEALVTSVEDYFRWTTSVTVRKSGGWLGIGRKRVETRTTQFYRRFYQDYYNLQLRLKQIGWYTLSVRTFPYPKLNPIAQAAFDRLPKTFHVKDLQLWQAFFNAFGTHITTSSNMGGQVWAESWYEKCLTYEHTQTWIREQVTRTWFWIFHKRSQSEDFQQTIDERFKQFSIFSAQTLGGTSSIDPSKWQEWLPTIKYQPRPISYRLIPLAELLPEGKQRQALQAAIDYVLKAAEVEDRTYIDQLQSTRGLEARKCSRNEIRTRQLAGAKKPTNISEARAALCPYIGYNGAECQGVRVRDRAFVKVPNPKLPVGVGMTMDITTGNLLLPALQFTYRDNKYWTDSKTNRSYNIPREVHLSEVDAAESNPVSRVFLSAAELSNEWKYEKLRGSWLGGEFGHSKSLLNVFSRFFTNNQATAITQKPTVLYRLRVENLQLNQYARDAVSRLTPVYQETLYNDFLRDWGTHIVQESLVGGMREQQVMFKDCVFSFHGAITQDNLVDYLKNDLLSQTLGNSFYANRRKISKDHRLGGDPTRVDEEAWATTIAANPALLKVVQYVPWSDMIEIDPAVRENLRKLIKQRTTLADQVRINEELQLNEQRVNGSHMAKQGSIGLLRNGKCEISPMTFGSVSACQNGCPTNKLLVEGAEFLDQRQLWYARDETTGFIRAQARISGKTMTEGLRVDAGCSTIDKPYATTASAHVCVSCDLINSFAHQCICACPTYS